MNLKSWIKIFGGAAIAAIAVILALALLANNLGRIKGYIGQITADRALKNNPHVATDLQVVCALKSTASPYAIQAAYSWDTKYGRIYTVVDVYSSSHYKIPDNVKSVGTCSSFKKLDSSSILYGIPLDTAYNLYYNAVGKLVVECDNLNFTSNPPICSYFYSLKTSDADLILPSPN